MEAGAWGEATSGSPAEGLLYARREEGCPTTIVAGVLALSEGQGSLEQLFRATTAQANARHLSNASRPNRCMAQVQFPAMSLAAPPGFGVPEISVIWTNCHRRFLGIELDRVSQDVFTEHAIFPAEQGACYVTASVGTNSPTVMTALQRAPEVRAWLAQLPRVEAEPDGTFITNHFAGCVIREPAPGLLRATFVLALDPGVPYFLTSVASWGVDYCQMRMVEDCMKGVLSDLKSQSECAAPVGADQGRRLEDRSDEDQDQGPEQHERECSGQSQSPEGTHEKDQGPEQTKDRSAEDRDQGPEQHERDMMQEQDGK